MNAVEIPPRPRPTLYDLTSDRADLVSIIDQLDYAEHAEAIAELMEQLAALDVELPHKVENLCRFVRNLEARAAAIKEERERLAAREAVAANKVQRLKVYLRDCLAAGGLTKLAAGIFDVSIRANGGKAPRDTERIEREIVPAILSGPSHPTNIPGVYVQLVPRLVIDDDKLPDEYKLPRGTHVRID